MGPGAVEGRVVAPRFTMLGFSTAKLCGRIARGCAGVGGGGGWGGRRGQGGRRPPSSAMVARGWAREVELELLVSRTRLHATSV